MKGTLAAVILGLAVAAAEGWLVTNRPMQSKLLTFKPAGSDRDAQRLVERMLRINRPWLVPPPARGLYSLEETYHGFSLRHLEAGGCTNGPFFLDSTSPIPTRVGCILETPLHAMQRAPGTYTVRMLGKTRWKGRTVVGVAVTFAPPARCAVGLGGQGGNSYSLASYAVSRCRLLIDPVEAIPLLVETWNSSTQKPANGAYPHTLWDFDPNFYWVAGGRAPRRLTWRGSAIFREQQTFQMVHGVWLFKQGTASWENLPWHGSSRLSRWAHPLDWYHSSQTFELVQLELRK